MAHTGAEDLGWSGRWSVVREVHEKLEFVAFFNTREEAETAAIEAGINYQVCWLTYKHGLFFPLEEKDSGQ